GVSGRNSGSCRVPCSVLAVTSQSLTLRSKPAVASVLPSGGKHSPQTRSLWPLRGATSLPAATSYSLTSPPLFWLAAWGGSTTPSGEKAGCGCPALGQRPLPEASSLPSGANASPSTSNDCAGSVMTSVAVAASQTLMVRSQLPVAKRLP